MINKKETIKQFSDLGIQMIIPEMKFFDYEGGLKLITNFINLPTQILRIVNSAFAVDKNQSRNTLMINFCTPESS